MTELKPKPDEFEISDEQWQNMPPSTRYYYRNRDEEKERIQERKEEIREWLADYKHERGCSTCGEEHPAALDFHHTDDKEAGVGDMANDGYSKEAILEEISKCVLLCANCHRKHHSDMEY